MPSVKKRCSNGTRRNKKTDECVTSVRLSNEDVAKLIEKHGLKPTASKMLKRLRLKTRTKNKGYTYKSTFNDHTNLMRQAETIITDILKHGPSPRRAELRSPKTKKTVLKGSPVKGTTF